MEIYLEGELFKYNSRSVYVGRARHRRTFLDQDVPEKGQSTRNRRYMNNVMRENEAKELCQGRCCLFIAIGTFIRYHSYHTAEAQISERRRISIKSSSAHD